MGVPLPWALVAIILTILGASCAGKRPYQGSIAMNCVIDESHQRYSCMDGEDDEAFFVTVERE